MSGVDACPEHNQRTRSVRQLRYCFAIKHHGFDGNAAQWVPDLSREDEFSIFDEADWLEITDEDGNLYGLRRDEGLEMLDLGTRGEQIAKFWENGDQPWHGFPSWPLAEDAPENRRRLPAPREALLKMEQAGLLLPEQRKRLFKGKPAR